jgi:predicted dehydrogenase
MTDSKRIRVAVAGTSFARTVQIPVFQSHQRTTVVALSSGRLERARTVAAEHDIPGAYTNFEEMLDREKPDLVSIVTPPDLHHPMALAALERGIHVLCEKPFAMNLAQAKEMQAGAAKAGVVAMVDFEFRFLPARRFLLDLLQQNYVGEVRLVEFLLHFGWRSSAEDVGWSWWSDRARGGGALGALGSHAMDSLRLWLGPARRILCDLATFVPKREDRTVTSDDAYVTIVEFASGARAVVQMSAVAGVEDSRIAVYGSKGQLVIDHFAGQGISGSKRSSRTPQTLEIPPPYRLQKEQGHILKAPFRALVDSMIRAIDRGGPSPSPSFDDGVASQRLLDAARVSSDESRWIDL